MESLFLIIVVVLFALAISDLIVGVSNDAVNFLNSAIGAKAAPFKLIMIVAALGILVGAVFSSGMMEVARKGIFHPEHFYFNEIMIMFLAVMLTDIILLDGFNSLGMPTSTTVSIVFELLGAAVAMTLIKTATDPNALPMAEYINSSKALAIISGILLSVVVSFSVGALVMYLSRLLFSFNYEKKMKYFGAIFGGLAITAITYFILIKGAKGASFMTSDIQDFIKASPWKIVGVSFIVWTTVLQLCYWIFKINILRFIVLVGTFALAMAFAGNDLVNFIGVPLAGFESYKVWIASGAGDPEAFSMASLAGKVKTDTYLLVIAGAVMVVTLWTSKKARRVVQTSLDLSRQDEGDERFGSSLMARAIVRSTRNLSMAFDKITPPVLKRALEKQYDQTAYRAKIAAMEDAPSFDMIRASVNLVVASILIAFATSLKLPLSTTYVTFMVAMGTSLADQAWGRESAVYRVSGVISVIGGWFLTALIAFTAAFVVANIIYWGGTIATIVLILLAAFLIYRTHRTGKEKDALIEASSAEKGSVEEEILNTCSTEVRNLIDKAGTILCKTIDAFVVEDRKELSAMRKSTEKMGQKAKKLKANSQRRLKELEDNSIDTGLYYVQMLDYLRETVHSLSFVVEPMHNHVENNHKVFDVQQVAEMKDVCKTLSNFIYHSSRIIKESDFDKLDALQEEQANVVLFLKQLSKKQLKRLKKEQAGTRVSMLYITVLQELKGLVLNIFNIIKAQRDFQNQKL